MEYRVTRRYRNVWGEETLAWEAGDVVTLVDEVAAWVERDSPGTLAAVRMVERASDRMARRQMTRGGSDEQ